MPYDESHNPFQKKIYYQFLHQFIVPILDLKGRGWSKILNGENKKEKKKQRVKADVKRIFFILLCFFYSVYRWVFFLLFSVQMFKF